MRCLGFAICFGLLGAIVLGGIALFVANWMARGYVQQGPSDPADAPVPVHGQDDPFSWGVWVSLSEANYKQWLDCFNSAKRSHIGPYFGWLNAWLKPYPETMNLKTQVHLRDNGIRPYIELEPTDHPLAVEQRNGITVERVAELYTQMVHQDA